MNRRAVWFALTLALSPCIASAKDACIQLDDNGDVVVLKGGVRKGAKAVSGHYAQFVTIVGGVPIYNVMPMSGSAILGTNGNFVMGLTQYVLGFSQSGNTFSGATIFHHVVCDVGADGKLNVLDTCTDLTNSHPGTSSQVNRPGHVVDCGVAAVVP
jgi:hypothetical protein